MNRPTSFDDVSYFKNRFCGDLIVTTGVLYFFPHTNVAAGELENKDSSTEALDVLMHLFGWPILVLKLAVEYLVDLSRFLRRTLLITTNQPKLKQSGLWREGESNRTLQIRFDAYLAEAKKDPSTLVRFEYSLPKPLRFAQRDIRHLSVARGTLRFETAHDIHEFRIGFRRQRLLRDVLWECGFVSRSEIRGL